MRKPIIKDIDFGEYMVSIIYYGDGKIDVSVLDELGNEIEGIYITNAGDNNGFNFNLN
jgi:hypothetical protein